jgi:dTDP-4-amino-4,6-dideoxygalactose transaminase
MGYKYNLTDLASAIGLTQLEKLDALDHRRHELAEAYTRKLDGLEGLTLPRDVPDRRHAWHLYIVDVDSEACGVSRDEFVERLTRRGVATSVHFIPVHYHPHYAARLGYRRGEFPRAEAAFRRAVSLPLYPAMEDADLDYVVDAVRDALRS